MRNIKRLVVLLLAAVMALPVIGVGCAAENRTRFEDVPPTAAYAQAVTWCAENGLMNGVEDTRFDPDGSMTRAMLATVLYRQAGEPAVASEPGFTDTQPGLWYSNAVMWAVEKGVLRGYGDGKFGTDDPVSREMLNVVMARQRGEDPVWTGAAALAVNAKRSEAAVALYETSAGQNAPASGLEPAPSLEPETAEGRILVAYFSATNNTERIAQHIKTTLGDKADLFEIIPETPYTSADLNYNTDCRANREQNDPSARPAINGSVDDMAQYDVIFLGYPIWWGQAPKVLYTFVESYDLSGKTVVPFCTSGSSPIGSSATNLAEAASGATWLSGSRFSGSAGQAAVANWVKGLDLPQVGDTAGR